MAIAVTLGMIGLVLSGLVFYYEPRDVVYKNIDIPVLHGYDVVAYFSLGKWSHATKGKPSITYSWYNYTDPSDVSTTYRYTFWFSSEQNRLKFIDEPWRYTPRYGGFSAYKTAYEDYWQRFPDQSKPRGYHAPPCHPDAFIVYNGALYMEYSLEYKKLFMQSAQAIVRAADAKWASWYGSAKFTGPLNNFAVRGTFSYEEDSDSGVVVKHTF